MSFITGNKFDPNTDIPDLSGKVTLPFILSIEVSSNTSADDRDRSTS